MDRRTAFQMVVLGGLAPIALGATLCLGCGPASVSNQLARSQAALTLPITIDGTHLTDQAISVGGIGIFDSKTPLQLQLAPGPYLISLAQGASEGSFTVNPDGTLAFDASLDNLFSLPDPRTLKITAYQITIDGRDLDEQAGRVSIVGSYFDTKTLPLPVVGLAPGQYYLYAFAQQASLGAFIVKADGTGTLDFDKSLDSTFSGRGTTTLKLNANTVTIDGTALAEQAIRVDFVGSYFDTKTSQVMKLAPGPYTIYSLAQGASLGAFTVNVNGTLAIDSALDFMFSLPDPKTLKIKAWPITIDGSELPNQQIRIALVGSYFDTKTPQPPLGLAPGSYSIFSQTQGVSLGDFTVTPDGTVDFPAWQAGTFSGSGTSTLQIRGNPTGTKCKGSASCGTGFCVSGVCCTTACTGACEVCNATGSVGTCINATGPGTPSCAPYLCNGQTPTCSTTCSSDSDCAATGYCSAGQCLPRYPIGTPCTAADQCLSATCSSGTCSAKHCVSGADCPSGSCRDFTCCDTSCSGACQACTVSAGAVKDGVCANVTGTGSPPCAPLACNGTSASCPTGCTKDSDCAPGNQCSSGACVPKCVGGTGQCCTAADCTRPPDTCHQTAGANCTNGVCIYPTLSCPSGQVCANGSCGTPAPGTCQP